MKRLLVTIAVFVIAFSTAGCGSGKSKEYIEGLIADMEYACNNYDVQEILDNIDPDIADPIKFAYGFGTVVTESDKDDMAEDIINSVFGGLYSLGVSEKITPQTFFKSLKIEPVKYQIKKKVGRIHCRMMFESVNQHFKKFVEMEVIKFDGDWYVESFRLLSTKEASDLVD